MGLSRLAEQCRKCPFKDNCKNKRMESNNKNSLGYEVGQALAFVIGVCIAAILVALTVKLILWIL